MKIFLEFTKNDYEEHGYYEFKILSCCSPSNLWLVVDNGMNTDEGVVTHDFQYRKVVSLMEVSTRIQAGIELHGQVVTIALGNYGHLYNIVLNLGEDCPDYVWHQTENFINDADDCTELYLIDFDELHQSKEYTGLSLEESIKKLLLEDEIGYEIRTLRSIDDKGNILNVIERDNLAGNK